MPAILSPIAPPQSAALRSAPAEAVDASGFGALLAGAANGEEAQTKSAIASPSRPNSVIAEEPVDEDPGAEPDPAPDATFAGLAAVATPILVAAAPVAPSEGQGQGSSSPQAALENALAASQKAAVVTPQDEPAEGKNIQPDGAQPKIADGQGFDIAALKALKATQGPEVTPRHTGQSSPAPTVAPTDAAASTQGPAVSASVIAAGGQAGLGSDTSGSGSSDPGARDQKSAPASGAVAKTEIPSPSVATEPVVVTRASGPAAETRATPQTISHLAAQILGRTGLAKSTQFQVTLDPQGLGRVNVSVRIAADGAMSAAMSFDTPQAAAELRARSDDLQRALTQAGFNVADGALSFDVSSDGGRSGGRHNAWTTLDFEPQHPPAGLNLAANTLPTGAQLIAALRASRSGVDIRI